MVRSGVVSAPTIQQPSYERDQISISGSFNEGEAKNLALVLRYGSLPVALEVQQTRDVSATLGSDSLRAGVVSALVGLALVTVSACAHHDRGQSRAMRAAPSAAIGVNAYLWRATLDTLSFMPLTTADPWGGVINYGWYIDPQTPNERFKATVFILDRRLRADPGHGPGRRPA